MCLYSKIIKNRKYVANKKNGGIIPPIEDERVRYVAVGCGKCIECRKQKARQWQVRMMEDLKKHKNGRFITLTFSNESIKELAEELKESELVGYELDNQIATLAVRRFLERWRKKHKKSLRHWLVTELGHGNTEHLHIHGIVWTNESGEEIEEKWKYGWMWGKDAGNYVSERTVNYIMKYVTKKDEQHEEYNSIILTSPGIGANYTEKEKGDWKRNKYRKGATKESYTTRTGHTVSLPVYWRNKIYSEKERENLWIEKLDKQERWICGERVDISNGMEEYYRLLEFHRRRNRRLGYGSDEKNWNRVKYEKETRNLKIKGRIKNASGGM